MIKFTARLLLKNKVLWAWPVIAVIVALIVGMYGEIQSAGNSYSFLLAFGDSPPFPSAFFITGLIDFIILIAVIGLPSHFSKNLESERASLILSNPISRSEFFFSEFAAVMSVTFFYTLITDIILAFFLFIKAGIFPLQLYLAMLLFIPLYVFVIYVSIVLLLVLTRSYLASVLVAYLVISPLSAMLYNAETFLNLIGWNSDGMLGIFDTLSYVIPSTAGVEALMSEFNQGSMNVETDNGSIGQAMDAAMTGVFSDGFAAFDWQLLGFVLLSCLPFFLLSFYLMRRKQF